MSATTNILEPGAQHNRRQALEEKRSCIHSSNVSSPAAHANYWTACVALLSLTTMFVIAALWRPPDEPQFVLCPFRALTHLSCPGCGMTRAFCALCHGELWRAIKFNALSPFLFLAAILAWVRAAATVFRAERLRLLLARLPRPTPLATKVMLALVIVWWLARLAGGF